MHGRVVGLMRLAVRFVLARSPTTQPEAVAPRLRPPWHGHPAAQVVESVLRPYFDGDLPVNIRCWDGSRIDASADAPTLVVRHRRAWRHLLYAPNELGLARAFVSGDLDVEGDLYAVLSLRDRARTARLPLDKRDIWRLLGRLARMGALGPPPRRPAEESRLQGRLHSLRRDRDAISHHYDVGNDFYSLLLGPSMVYSCAYFESATVSLADAQQAKLDSVCRKLDLRPGMRLLDVGCGWGSLVIHAACRYGVRAVGVTLSAEQAELARKRVTDAGIDDLVDIRVQDYREVDDGPYDAIASIGMAEHVGRDHLSEYASTLRALLRPGGLLLNSAIATGPANPTDTIDPQSFLIRYVFPDGDLQHVSQHVDTLENAGLEVRDVQAMREHYARTCRAWVANIERNWEQAVRLVSPGRARVWRLYLTGSALSFDARRIGVNQVLALKHPTTKECGAPGHG